MWTGLTIFLFNLLGRTCADLASKRTGESLHTSGCEWKTESQRKTCSTNRRSWNSKGILRFQTSSIFSLATLLVVDSTHYPYNPKCLKSIFRCTAREVTLSCVTQFYSKDPTFICLKTWSLWWRMSRYILLSTSSSLSSFNLSVRLPLFLFLSTLPWCF